jgi:hypothetical protein
MKIKNAWLDKKTENSSENSTNGLLDARWESKDRLEAKGSRHLYRSEIKTSGELELCTKSIKQLALLEH